MDWLAYWPVIGFAVGSILLPALIWAIRIGLASKADLAGETKARGEAMDDLEGRLMEKLDRLATSQSGLSDRTLVIESEIRHLPSSEDIAEVKSQLTRADARLESLDREMQSINRALKRVEDHLLKGISS